MAINLGDAILNFRGDLTQLNLAFDETAQSAEKLAPAQAQVDALGAAFDRVATDAEAAAAAMQTAGAVGTEAGAQVSSAWLKVATATAENYKAQRELQLALRDVKATGGEGAASLDRYAMAAEQAAVASQNLRKAQQEAATGAVELATAEKVAGESAIVMGAEMEVAGTEAAFSMREAKASMALAGEEMGIKIPRHIRGFIAELPGVGAAMEAAFSGIAVLILVQILVEAAKKLSEFVGETFIYTEAVKEEYAAQVKLNDALAEQSKKLHDLKEAYDYIGLSGSAKTAEDVKKLNVQWIANEAAIDSAKTTLSQYKQELADAPSFGKRLISNEDAQKAERDLQLALKIRETFTQQFANLAKTGDAEILAEHVASTQASLDADKKVADARLALRAANLNLQFVQGKISATEEMNATREFNEQKYQSEVNFLERKKSLAAQDPTKSAEKVRAVNAEILALELKHQSDIVEANAKAAKLIRQNWAQTEDSKIPVKLELTPEIQALNTLLELMKSFNMQGSATWAEQKAKALDAMEAIKKAGGSEVDVLVKQIEAQKADIELAKSMGLPWKELQKDLDETTKRYDKLTGAVVKLGTGHINLGHQLDQFAKKLREERGELTKNEKQFDSVLMSATGAMGNAVAQWILGEDSLGIALRRGLAQEAATIAGKAAMWGLYYTAWGIADSFWNPARAGADFAAAAEFFAVAGMAGAFAYAVNPRQDGKEGGAPGGVGPIETAGAAGQADSTPVQTQNVQHFAQGGLVSGRTLAMIGDSVNGGNATEAAIPLDNPRAVSKIVEALGGGGGNTYITNKFDGVISADNLHKVMKKMDRSVKRGGQPLTSSNSLRVTKRG